MKNLSKLISTIGFVLSLNIRLFSQCTTGMPPVPNYGGNQVMSVIESKNGHDLPVNGTIRVLIVLAEINYDTGTDPTLPINPLSLWQPHQIPAWALSTTNPHFIDPTVTTNPQGLLTKYFYQASSGNYNVIGDFLIAPSNGGVFTINNSQGVSFSNLFTSINTVMNGNFTTLNNLNNVTNFDNWTKTNAGLPKITPSIDNPHKYDHVMILWRNRIGYNGTGNASYSGFGSTFLGYDADTYSNFGANFSNGDVPFNIARHEFSHILYGGNNFHCGGGGGPENYWIPLESGWSNMSLYNGSLNSWNAWDRQRNDWKVPGQNYSISVRNATNTSELNGDLDASISSQAGTFTLRDFVTYGDALRIKLPYTNAATEYPEYIWIENHNGQGINASPFDRWQHEGVANPCIQGVVPGIYMYLQIDKDVRQAATYSEVYGGYADYLKPIVANGNYDREYDGFTTFNACIQGGNTDAFKLGNINSLTGCSDQDWNAHDLNGNNVIESNENKENYIQNLNGNYLANLFNLGNSGHAFSINGNKKIGMGTNPSSASAMNMVSLVYPPVIGAKNHRKTDLNGISIEILSQSGGNIQVQVRFDDVDINNDTRWCSDEIIANPITSPSGYSINVKSGITVTIDQGTTATRMDSPQIINGKKVFAPPTLFRCINKTFINMETGSKIIVDNGSTFKMEAGSRLDIANGAELRIRKGSHLVLENGSTINVADGGKIIIEEDALPAMDGMLEFYPNARINLDGGASQLEIAGNLDIKDNATFTVTSNASNPATRGSVKFSSTDAVSDNITAGNNCKMILQSNLISRKIVYITQESLYPPDNLTEFTLQSGTAVLSNNSRIFAPLSATCLIKFVNARITSTNNVRNTHRGVVLNGQPNVVLSGSNFSNGIYGINAFNSMFGGSLSISNCTFSNCDIGFYVQNKGVNMTNTNFNGNTIGWQAEAMSFPSTATVGYVKFNTQHGIFYQSPGTSSLTLTDPLIDNNVNGLTVKQTTVNVSCGSISTNSQYGIYLKNQATLYMNGNGTVNAQTTAINNGVTLQCYKASNFYLNGGYNNLTPLTSGTQSAINGTLQCQTYAPIAAYNNKWNVAGTALTTSDYFLTTSCSTPTAIIVNDPQPISPLACGQAVPPCNNCLAAQADALQNCPTCQSITTTDYNNMRLNDASLDAILMHQNDSILNNEKEALDRFNQILMEPLNTINIKEDFLLDLDYNKMKEALGSAYGKGQLQISANPITDDIYMQMMLEVQDKILQQAISSNNYDQKLYVSIEKAQTYRIAGKLTAAITVLDDILSWADFDDQDMVNHFKCLTEIEKQVHEGNLNPREIQAAVATCTGGTLRTIENSNLEQNTKNIASEEKLEVSVYPNPATTAITFTSSIAGQVELTIRNVVGQLIATENFTGSLDLLIEDFNQGVYLYEIKSASGYTVKGKFTKQ
jgi:hypothetical protein